MPPPLLTHISQNTRKRLTRHASMALVQKVPPSQAVGTNAVYNGGRVMAGKAGAGRAPAGPGSTGSDADPLQEPGSPFLDEEVCGGGGAGRGALLHCLGQRCMDGDAASLPSSAAPATPRPLHSHSSALPQPFPMPVCNRPCATARAAAAGGQRLPHLPRRAGCTHAAHPGRRRS